MDPTGAGIQEKYGSTDAGIPKYLMKFLNRRKEALRGRRRSSSLD